MDRTVNIEPVKKFARHEMKDYPITQGYILSEPEAISIDEFVVKLVLWSRSLKMESLARSG